MGVRAIPTADEVVDRARAIAPGLVRAEGPVRRSIKSVLVPCTLDGVDVIVKHLFDDGPAWSWYARRELRVLEALAVHDARPLGFRVPRALASGEAIVVMERLPGRPVAARRHALRPPPARWDALLACVRSIRSWPAGASVVRALADLDHPDGARERMMRQRVLEDPSRPIDWIVEGLARVGAPHREQARAALVAHPVARFQHGDLLLRNVLDDGEMLGLVDWECAGLHAEAWDAALLWPWAPDPIREALAFEREPARSAFFACVVFAISRELFYRRRKGEDAVTARLRDDLSRASELLLR